MLGRLKRVHGELQMQSIPIKLLVGIRIHSIKTLYVIEIAIAKTVNKAVGTLVRPQFHLNNEFRTKPWTNKGFYNPLEMGYVGLCEPWFNLGSTQTACIYTIQTANKVG